MEPFPLVLGSVHPLFTFRGQRSLLRVRIVLGLHPIRQIYLSAVRPFRYFPIGILSINRAVGDVMGFDSGYSVVAALTFQRWAIGAPRAAQSQSGCAVDI